jgi:hypothetical protein
MSCHFDVFRSDLPLRRQLKLVDDDEKFTCQSPQSSTRAAALSTMLKKANTCVEERR